VITILLALGATLVAGAAGHWAYARTHRSDPEPKPPPPQERGPLALGDVIVLDEGRGDELWIARELALCEGEGAPWLVLFEADGPAAARAILAWDPADATSFAVLRPLPIGGIQHVPSTLEVEVEGASLCLGLIARRTSTAVCEAAPSAEGASDLAPQGELLVATYRGGARGFAVVAKSHDRTRLYAGHRVAMHEVSVLAVDHPS